MENPGENFLSRAHKSHPPKSGGKLWREKCSHSQIMEMPYLSQWSQQLSKEEEDNFPTTKSAQLNYHHRNPKITQNQHKNNLKSTQTPLENPSQTQLKINPKQNQLKINPSSSSSLFLVAFELSKKKKREMQRLEG